MRKILILSLGFALSLGAQAKDYHRTADTTTVVCRLSADGMLRPLKPSYMKGALELRHGRTTGLSKRQEELRSSSANRSDATTYSVA